MTKIYTWLRLICDKDFYMTKTYDQDLYMIKIYI